VEEEDQIFKKDVVLKLVCVCVCVCSLSSETQGNAVVFSDFTQCSHLLMRTRAHTHTHTHTIRTSGIFSTM